MMRKQPGTPVADQVWLITGTSSGMGRALARAVIDQGGRVVATARELSAVADLAARAPGRVATARLDVTDPGSVRVAVEAALAAFGRIDVLVNNAGYGLLGAFEELDEEQIRAQFETNLFGAMTVTRAVLPIFRRQGAGCVVAVSSVIGVVPGPGGAAYAGSKFAMEGVFESLAAEVAHLGIHVVIVEPGPFRTEASGRSPRWGEPMADYAALIGPARKAFEATHGKQPGDPYRGAQAIIAAVGLDQPPLRLPLGAESFAWIRSYLRSRLDALDGVEPIGSDTAFR